MPFSNRFFSYHPVVPWDDREPLPATQGTLPRHPGPHQSILGPHLGILRVAVGPVGRNLDYVILKLKNREIQVCRRGTRAPQQPLTYCNVNQTVVGGCLGLLEVVPGHPKALRVIGVESV